MPASLWLTLLKGGPFDGLPTLELRFEQEDSEIDLGPCLEILNKLNPPPMHLHLLYVDGANELDPLQRFLAQAAAYGMAISVESFSGFLPWMASKLIGWRTLHVEDDTAISSPVEEIVYHSKEVPAFEFYPFHHVHPPLIWWDAGAYSNALARCPQGMRLWSARKVPEILLFPKEETE
jgi:hypothetical protein